MFKGLTRIVADALEADLRLHALATLQDIFDEARESGAVSVATLREAENFSRTRVLGRSSMAARQPSWSVEPVL
jgi:hypothetical protein